MTLQLYAHPFSSYCQKVLIALYENDVPFTLRMLEPSEKRNLVEFAKLSPMARMPVLVDGERVVLESSVIIEYLGLYHPGPVTLVPADAKAALEVRMLDRVFDNYIMGQMQKFVFDRIRPENVRDA
ncbi:MAG: glutathione S-transferase N-terminal domain-containing protein, partial [Hyphomicrobium sp.]|nr:glutathione S-transferase N-terminal domain-containing protein [Hyphomicrobium sp.]